MNRKKSDIVALLSTHIKTLIYERSGVVSFFDRNSGVVGFVVWAMLFFSALGLAFVKTYYFIQAKTEVAKNLAKDSSNFEAIGRKVDYLVSLSASGTWLWYFFGLACFIIASLIISIILACITANLASNKAPSFLVFSQYAQRQKEMTLKDAEFSLKLFIGSLFLDVAVNVVAACLFTYWIQKWFTP